MSVELKRVDQNSFATGKDESLPSTKAQDSDPALVEKFKEALDEKPEAKNNLQGSLGSYEKQAGQDQKATQSLQSGLFQDETFKADKGAQNLNDLSSIFSSLMSGQSATTGQNPGEILPQNQTPTSNLD